MDALKVLAYVQVQSEAITPQRAEILQHGAMRTAASGAGIAVLDETTLKGGPDLVQQGPMYDAVTDLGRGDQAWLRIMDQAESALQKALLIDGPEKISCFIEHDVVERKPVITDEDMRKAFEHVLNGAYVQVPDHMLEAVAEKLTPFLDYVADRSDTGRTGTDDS